MPHLLFAAAFLALAAFASPLHAQAVVHERADWGRHFDASGATGTIIVLDARGNSAPEQMVFDTERAHRAFSPASTFKIPHALFALEAGVVSDEFQVFEWDGTEHRFADHNRDHDLRSSMRASAVWVYEHFAEAIGEPAARGYLRRIDYGNADTSAGEGPYWIEGGLAISARGQIDFLQRLYRNALPFAVENQRLVKDIIIVEAGQDWILRAKTGWSGKLGWWVGWVEWPEGPVFFALNIDTPNGLDDLPKRQAIARDVLVSLKALPAGDGD